MGNLAIQSVILLATYACTVALLLPSESWRLWLAVAVCPTLVWISISDLSRREIPDLASIAIACAGGVALAVDPEARVTSTLLLAGLVLTALWGLSEAYWRITGHEALGLGDAKLIGAGTLLVGADRLWLVLLLASLGGIVSALISPAGRTVGIPFGPFIAYAILIALLMSERLP